MDTGLTNDVVYYYVVTAVDNSGNESSYSSEVSLSAGAAVPVSVSVTPSDAVIAFDTPMDLTGRVSDSNGHDDLRIAEFRVSTGFSNAPRCFVRYDHNSNLLRLFDDGPRVWVNAGSPGSGNVVSNTSCTLDAAASAVTEFNATTLDVMINVSFTSAMEGVKNVWLRGFEDGRNWGTQVDLGDLTITSDATAPAAPTSVTGTAGDTLVTLDWNDNPEPDVDGYHVYRALTSGGPYTQVNGSLLTSSDFVDTSLTNDLTYFYVVAAVDTAGNQSDDSLEFAITPVADTVAPSAPVSLVATAGDAVVTLDWADNTESDLAGYNVLRASSSGGPYNTVNGSVVIDSQFVDTGLTNNQTYYYVVTAVDNSANESAPAS